MEVEAEQYGGHVGIVLNGVVYDATNNGFSGRTRSSIESKFQLGLRNGCKASKEHEEIEKNHQLRHGFVKKRKGFILSMVRLNAKA